MNKHVLLGITIAAILYMAALVATAHANRPRHPKPKPPPTQPAPPPPRLCPDGLPPTPGEGAFHPNDDCARAPASRAQPSPPPVRVALTCPAGMTEIGRSVSQVMCSRTIKVVRVKNKVVVKKAKPRTKFVRYCPRKPDEHGLAG